MVTDLLCFFGLTGDKLVYQKSWDLSLRKGENDSYKHFLLSPECFQKLSSFKHGIFKQCVKSYCVKSSRQFKSVPISCLFCSLLGWL